MKIYNKILTASRRRRSIRRSSARFAAARSDGVVGVPGEPLPCGDAFISSTTRCSTGAFLFKKTNEN